MITADPTTGALLSQTPTFVAVGEGGAVLTGTYNNVSGVSTLTWTSQTIAPYNNLTAVTFGTRSGGNSLTQYNVASYGQFVAVDNAGNAYTSTDGLTWSASIPTNATGPLNAIGAGVNDYTAVGAGGHNAHSL